MTLKPNFASRAMATLPTPPAAPVTSTGPLPGLTPCRSSASTQSMAVYPAVPIAMHSAGENCGGIFKSQSPLTRAICA